MGPFGARMRGQRESQIEGEPGPEAPVAAATQAPEIVLSGSPAAPAERRFRLGWPGWKRFLLAGFVLVIGLMAVAYLEKDQLSPKVADLSRRVIGDENTARVESWFFRFNDEVDQIKYRIFGGNTDPFAVAVHVEFAPQPKAPLITFDVKPAKQPVANTAPWSLGPPPMVLPQTRQVDAHPQPGEGEWSTAGLPHTTPEDVLMAKTFFHPDPSRPYATVAVLVVDSRRIQLHMTAGTEDPGGFRGVPGPGVIPQDQLTNLLAAWNGGFKGPHGNFGMYADGTTYVPLRNGLASLVLMKDGSIHMGTWGTDLAWNDNIEAVRQNAVLLVDHGEISPRTNEGNDTWGYVEVNSSEFITWRSAVGLTRDGNLIVAAGNSLSAATLAKALWAAGAWTAMELDINSPYVLTSLFFQQPGGTITSERFMDSMPGSPTRFLGKQTRDFMWVTLKPTPASGGANGGATLP